MKTLIILAAMLVMGFVSGQVLPTASAYTIMPQVVQKRDRLNVYYIGVHRPDGSCETIEVMAKTLDNAYDLVKVGVCDSCALDDLTAEVNSAGPEFTAQAVRFCPIR